MAAKSKNLVKDQDPGFESWSYLFLCNLDFVKTFLLFMRCIFREAFYEL